MLQRLVSTSQFSSRRDCFEELCSILKAFVCVCVSVQWLSSAWLLAASWAVARRVPLSMGFPIQEYWTGLPFPSPGDLSDQPTDQNPTLYSTGNSIQCSCFSVTQSCPTLHNPKDCSMPSFPVLHHHPGLAQSHVHWVVDVILPSHSLLSLSPPAFNRSQHQGLFQGVRSLHQVVMVLEFQLQHQSFQWIFRIYFH